MVYTASEQNAIHRPIIHLVKDFLYECNKYNTIVEKSKFALPMIGSGLDLHSICVFKVTLEQHCESVYSWPKKSLPSTDSFVKQKHIHKNIEDFFFSTLLSEIDIKGFSTYRNKQGCAVKSEQLKGVENAFVSKIMQGKQLYGYIAFAFDRPIQFNQEIIDTLLSFVEILGTQSNEPLSNITLSSSSLFEKSDNIIAILSKSGKVITINPAYEKLLQKKPSSTHGKDLRKAFNFVNNQGHMALNSAISGEALKQICLEVYAANYDKKWLSFNFTPYKDNSAQMDLILVTANDVTFQKELELSLRKRDMRSHLTSFATQDTCYDWDYESNSIWWNNNIHEHFGHLHSSKINHRLWWEQQIHPDDITYIKRTFESAFESKSPTCSLEYRFKFINGDYAYVSDTAFISYDKHFSVTRLTGAIKDISEQRAAEMELRKSRDSLSKLANRLQEAREDERRNLAKEFHGEFTQLLTALKFDISYLEKHNEVDKKQIKVMLNVVDQMMGRVQTIAHELRPTILDDLGLIHAISSQLNNFYDLTDCDISLINKFENIVFKEEAVTPIFRIFQESLANVAHHADATEVVVTVKNIHSRFTLAVSDNGSGIPAKYIDNPNTTGLLDMKERAQVLGGDVVIQKNEHGGTTVTLLVPIKNCIESYEDKRNKSYMSLPSKTEGGLII